MTGRDGRAIERNAQVLHCGVECHCSSVEAVSKLTGGVLDVLASEPIAPLYDVDRRLNQRHMAQVLRGFDVVLRDEPGARQRLHTLLEDRLGMEMRPVRQAVSNVYVDLPAREVRVQD